MVVIGHGLPEQVASSDGDVKIAIAQAGLKQRLDALVDSLSGHVKGYLLAVRPDEVVVNSFDGIGVPTKSFATAIEATLLECLGKSRCHLV